MKVKMYIDLFQDDIVNNKKMLTSSEHWSITATNTPYSGKPYVTQDRISFEVDLPDKYFVTVEDYIAKNATNVTIEDNQDD